MKSWTIATVLSFVALLFACGIAPAQPPQQREFQNGRRAFSPDERGPRSEGARVDAIKNALDTDGDGELSAEEIANAKQALAKLDKNGDGKLDADELGLRRRPRGEDGRQGDRRGGTGGRGGPGSRGDGGQQGGMSRQGGGGGPGSREGGGQQGGMTRRGSGGRGGAGGRPGDGGGSGGGSGSYTLLGAYVVDGKVAKEESKTFVADEEDTSAVYVKNGGELTLVEPKIVTSGDTSSQQNSSFYGLNAAALATAGSKLKITGGSITSTGAGANGVFAYGRGAEIELTKVFIKASGGGGHGVMASGGGALTLIDTDIVTERDRAAPVATDRGSGTIVVRGGKFKGAGRGSPGIYSTGDIRASNATFIATGSQACVIEGSNSITLKDCELTGSQRCGVMVYQSFSGDARGRMGEFTMEGGSLTATEGPLFYVTNTHGVIKLSDVKTSAADGVLCAASDRWGREGSNGGNAELIVEKTSLKGDLECDEISSIAATLKKESTLSGAIRGASLSLDSTSKWSVTADSILAGLAEIEGVTDLAIPNIEGNGHQVTYDASLPANQWLKGKTYALAGGGELVPRK